jgi:flagellin
MSIGDLSRINTNVQSLQALGQLNKTNSQLGVRQMRLATGSRLNRAEDDSAGYTIAKKLEAKTRGQAQALSNIGDAKGMLTVGEGSLGSAMDILQTMKEKAVQAGNATMGVSERAAIQSQIEALGKELDDVLATAEFNGIKLFEGQDLDFQVGASAGDSFSVNFAALTSAALVGESAAVEASDATGIATGAGNGNVDAASLVFSGAADASIEVTIAEADGVFTATWGDSGSAVLTANQQGVQIGDFTFDVGTLADGTFTLEGTAAVAAREAGTGLDVSSHASAASAITTIDAAINTVSSTLASIGDAQSRLTFKQDNLQTSMTNYEAARSRIADADFAKEQMEIVKLQILQQTGIASMAQANMAPQAVLSLIG